MMVNISKLVAESGYHNPHLLVQLLGCANEFRVVVEEVEMTALVDTGSQMSALTEGFCTETGLRILPLRNLVGAVLHLEEVEVFQYCTEDTWRMCYFWLFQIINMEKESQCK